MMPAHRESIMVVYDLLIQCREGGNQNFRNSSSERNHIQNALKKGLIEAIYFKVPYSGSGRRRHKLAKKPQMKDKLIYITTEEGEKFISFVEKYWIDWHDR